MSINFQLFSKSYTLLGASLLLMSSCQETANKNNVNDHESLCFQNEYPFEDDESVADILSLTLSVNGRKVTGSYNWLPAQKDQRKGILSGQLNGNTITADYIYSQEGNTDTVSIKIIINEERAVVSGGMPELGLNASIDKAQCDN